MANICKKYIKDILQETGRSIFCFIFVTTMILTTGGWGNWHNRHKYIHKQLKKFEKYVYLLKFMLIAYPAAQFCIIS